MNRRNFLKLGALFVPVAAAPTVAYSFIWARERSPLDEQAEQWNLQRLPGEDDDQFRVRIIRHMWQPEPDDWRRARRDLIDDVRLEVERLEGGGWVVSPRGTSGVVTLTAKYPGARSSVVRL